MIHKIRLTIIFNYYTLYRNNSLINIVEFYFKNSEIIPIRRSEHYSLSSLIADCGGIFALFMGCSLISLIDMIYYCTIRPILMYHNCRKKSTDRKLMKNYDKIYPRAMNELPIETHYYYY